MKKLIFLSFLVFGFTSVTGQLLIIKEIALSFYGNEIFYGLIIGFWFIWLAISLIFFSGIFSGFSSLKILTFCHLLVPLIIFFAILLIRLAGSILPSYNQSVNPILGTLYLVLIILPLCLVMGLQLTVAGRQLSASPHKRMNIFKLFFRKIQEKISRKKEDSRIEIINHGFFYEILGLICGGLFYYLFFIYFGCVEVFLFLLFINYLLILFLPGLLRTKVILGFLFFIIIISCLNFNFFDDFLRHSESWRFGREKFIKSTNSSFSGITITQDGNHYNFYANRLPIGSTKKDFSSEEVIHSIVILHEKPKNILLIGGGFGSLLQQIVKYPIDNLDYLEIDYKLVEIARPYLEFETKYDDRINFIPKDPFRHLKNASYYYDLIIINLPDPSTLQLNRFYSVDFFELVKRNLAYKGILAFSLSFHENYPPSDFESIFSSIYKSLSRDFSSVSVSLLNEKILFSSSDSKIDFNPDILELRFRSFNLEGDLFKVDYFKNQFLNIESNDILERIKKDNYSSPNFNTESVAFWQYSRFWLLSYYPSFSKYLEFFFHLSLLRLILIIFILFFGLYYVLDVLVKKNEKIFSAITMVFQFSVSSAAMCFVFLLQIIYGSLYHQLSLIFVMLFLGSLVGFWMVSFSFLNKKIKYHYLFRLYFCFGVYLFLLAMTLRYYPESLKQPSIFYFLIFSLGLFPGFEFPIINKYYLKDKQELLNKTGAIHGAGMMGAGFGAIFSTLFFLPVLGFEKTFILAAFLNFLAFTAMFFLRQNFEEN